MPTHDKPKEEKPKIEKEAKLTFEDLVKQEVRKQLTDIRKELTEDIQKELEEVRRTAVAINGSLSNFECYLCSKGIVHTMGGYYTNYEGYKFCSDKCLERCNVIKGEQNAKTNDD